MLRLIQPIYSFFLFRKLMPLRLPKLHLQKIATYIMMGTVVLVSLAPSIQAQIIGQSPDTETVIGLPSAQENYSYIDMSGWLDASSPSLVLGKYQWVSVTHRLSRGYSGGHPGLDIDGEFGDPIYAMTDGEVTEVTTTGPYGNKIIIKHPGGMVTLYAHLQIIAVQPGQSVTSGQFLGEMGSTGRSTGSHLHFEAFRQGVRIDPAILF